MLHSSVTVYILVITIGQLPAELSELLTVISTSNEVSSVIKRFPGRASNSATVVTAGAATLISQPSIYKSSNDPVITGASVSPGTNIIISEFFLHLEGLDSVTETV